MDLAISSSSSCRCSAPSIAGPVRPRDRRPRRAGRDLRGCCWSPPRCRWFVFVDVGLGGKPRHRPHLSPGSTSARFDVDWALRVDTLSAVMLIVVTIVSSLVHLYSVGYMAEDTSRSRASSPICRLFTFAMLMLVTADNLMQLFFGWEGVGLASYLLIGFWYDKPTANAAAIKAFIVNRVGDFGFALGIIAVFLMLRHRSQFDDDLRRGAASMAETSIQLPRHATCRR